MSRWLLHRFADERGQSLVFFVILLVGLALMLALVVDVGSWLRAQRQTQSVTDAAALAGVQELPFDQASAAAHAIDIGQQNWPGVAIDAPSFPDASTIEVAAHHDVPGFFSTLAGIFNVTVHARAEARVEANRPV